MLTLGERTVDASVLLNLSRDCGFFFTPVSTYMYSTLELFFLYIYLVPSLLIFLVLRFFYFSSLFFGCVDFIFPPPKSALFFLSKKKRAGEEEQYVRRTAPVGCPAAPPCTDTVFPAAAAAEE